MPANDGVFGIGSDVVTTPATGTARPSRSGAASSEQPGGDGRIAANGTATAVKPVTTTARPIGGMPVAVARNVEPTHGAADTVSTFGPPEPVQPVPAAVAVA